MTLDPEEADGFHDILVTVSPPPHLELTGLLADLSIRVGLDGFRPHAPDLPPPVRLKWADVDMDIEGATLTLVEDKLVLLIPNDDGTFFHRAHVLNQEAELALTDGGIIRAQFAHFRTAGTIKTSTGEDAWGVWLDLHCWIWEPAVPPCNSVFIAEAKGIDLIRSDNLALRSREGSDRSISRMNLRLEGTLTWHIVHHKSSHFALFQGCAATVTDLRNDFRAICFVLGTGIEIHAFWRLDENERIVGGVGPGFRKYETYKSRVPTPEFWGNTSCWPAVLFSLLARSLSTNNDALSSALSGYFDTLERHIHGGYILGHIALEAASKALVPEDKGSELAESKAWRSWKKHQRSDIQRLAFDDESFKILWNKLGTAIRRPTGTIVARAFKAHGIELPERAIAEVQLRGRVAHMYTMFDESTGEIGSAVERLEIVQSLLAAIVALHVGYRGALAGWEKSPDGHNLSANFWPGQGMPEAQTEYICSRPTPFISEPSGF